MGDYEECGAGNAEVAGLPPQHNTYRCNLPKGHDGDEHLYRVVVASWGRGPKDNAQYPEDQ